MEATDAGEMRKRARASYERGRLVRAATEGTVVAPLIAASVIWGVSAGASLVAGALLAVVVIALRTRGEHFGRAAITGLLAGLVPMLLPLALHRTGWCCVGGMACTSICYTACVAGGVIAGAVVGARSLGGQQRPLGFMASAALVALLVGSLGCVVSGTAGVLGLAAALAASAVPVAIAGRLLRGGGA